MNMRRRMAVAVACILGGYQLSAAVAGPSDPVSGTANPLPTGGRTELVLLGTGGGPGAMVDRAGIASLVRVAGRPYLIDAGEGVARQLVRAGVPERSLGTVFLTHLHDDHTAGLPALLTFAYTLRTRGIAVYGPPDTSRLITGILAYMAVNADIRGAEQASVAPETVVRAKPVVEGIVFADEFVTVDAVRNAHYHFATAAGADRHDSYAYRFRTRDKVIVFTGDTGPSAAVERLAMGADILVAEMTSPADVARVPPDIAKHMIQDHLSPSQVGALAAKARVGTLVLSHIRSVSEQDLGEIRARYAGQIVVGKDLDKF